MNKKFILLAFLILALFVFKNFLTNLTFLSFGKPLASWSAKVIDGNKYGHALFNFYRVEKENESLRRENSQLLGQSYDNQRLEKENQSLRGQLKISSAKPAHLMSADIFKVVRDQNSSAVLINAGLNQGVRQGQAVVAFGNVLIGTVKQVFSDSSEVLLIDDPKSSVGVKIGGKAVLAATRGLLRNSSFMNRTQFSLNLITSQEDVTEGDEVFTSGLDGLPQGLIVGKVLKVDSNSSNLFSSVIADALFDPLLSPEVFVIFQDK